MAKEILSNSGIQEIEENGRNIYRQKVDYTYLKVFNGVTTELLCKTKITLLEDEELFVLDFQEEITKVPIVKNFRHSLRIVFQFNESNNVCLHCETEISTTSFLMRSVLEKETVGDSKKIFNENFINLFQASMVGSQEIR